MPTVLSTAIKPAIWRREENMEVTEDIWNMRRPAQDAAGAPQVETNPNLSSRRRVLQKSKAPLPGKDSFSNHPLI